MSYLDDVTSQAAGATVELYTFTGPATTWRYTSGQETVSYGGHDYEPLAALTRGEIAIGTTWEARPLQVTMPTSAQVVSFYAFGLPPRTLHLTVTSLQERSGEAEDIWSGEVTSITPHEQVAVVESPSALGAQLTTTVPAQTIRRHCNHRLGDEHCRVDLTAFTHTTTVASVSTDGYTVTVSGVGTFPDQRFRSGTITRDTDGEVRTIVGQVGAVLLIASPFTAIANPDAVTMVAGCKHDQTDCEDTYDNLDNFGGFATIPRMDPFRVPIKLGEP